MLFNRNKSYNSYFIFHIFLILFVVVFFVSFNFNTEQKICVQDMQNTVYQYPVKTDIAVKMNDSVSYFDGYGSSLVKHPSKKNYFYLLTDRGPNFTVKPKKTNLNYSFEFDEDKKYKGFPDTNFTPRIGLFYFDGKQFTQVKTIYLNNQDGVPLLGITSKTLLNEIPVFINESTITKIKKTDNSIDSEGLVACQDGSFWICDEYEPALFHFDENGRMTHKKINPINKVNINGIDLKLPQVFSKRKVNAGLEGVTSIKNDSVLICVIQKPLINYKNDKKLIKNCRYIRICSLNLFTGEVKEFVYVTENPKMFVSEIRSINDSTFLVIERDGNSPDTEASNKMIYKIMLQKNTSNIHSNDDSEFGKLYDGKTLEELSLQEFENFGIIPFKKELFFDILKEIPDFQHEKVEGMELVDNKLFFVNDNDFAIDFANKKGTIIQVLNKDKIDNCIIYSKEIVR